ncbi:segregation and condensation protein A [Acetobacterium woodii]|uniref:Segregation and condensation protein A n=1 Tax=Acetobacterium woodii (strain ATCC 29683 / DSM 1030 / JCM 2381 / KCTC 1655 / WB1) TaxID=931626 RepID=H6LCH4_ACEWD|nr:segregation/condensation protein A [Acetobacterium woodii]AFA47756.1 chromosome segregation and condensation protein A [Acetobacterium woodii DSM 1030]
MAYAVSLETFEGPLDLLISLILKNKIDICDIPIATITNQYLLQIKTWQDMDMDVASEFIVMAARLLEIKAKALLPKNEEEKEDAEELQAKLVRQLVEYKIFKEISRYFQSREQAELCVIYRDPEYIPQNLEETPLVIDPYSLEQCFKQLLFQKESETEIVQVPQKIIRELFSIEEKIAEILDKLVQAGAAGVSFSELLHPDISREEVVVTLLSLLEMVKTNGLRLLQNRVFIDFWIQREEDDNE